MNTFASVSGMPYGKTKEEHRAYMRWWRSLNREDYNKKRLEWASTHRERRIKQARNSHLKQTFGITLEEYDDMLAKQDYRCAICASPLREISDSNNRKRTNLCIDHNHETGEIRGILCFNCNLALGLFFENPKILISAIKYLKNTRNIDDKSINAARWFDDLQG